MSSEDNSFTPEDLHKMLEGETLPDNSRRSSTSSVDKEEELDTVDQAWFRPRSESTINGELGKLGEGLRTRGASISNTLNNIGGGITTRRRTISNAAKHLMPANEWKKPRKDTGFHPPQPRRMAGIADQDDLNEILEEENESFVPTNRRMTVTKPPPTQ